MVKQLSGWLFAPLVGILVAGCNGGSLSFAYHDHEPAHPRHVDRVHVCTPDCHHHYHDGTRLVVLKGHRHGPGCGHVWTGKRWVVARKVPTRHVRHVCTPDCHHHYHDGTKVVVLKGHRHGPGCGHKWNGKHWVRVAQRPAYPPRAVPTPRRVPRAVPAPTPVHNRVYDRATGKWVAIHPNHVHGRGCGHVYINGRWCIRR